MYDININMGGGAPLWDFRKWMRVRKRWLRQTAMDKNMKMYVLLIFISPVATLSLD